jgi:PKD repeat protein
MLATSNKHDKNANITFRRAVICFVFMAFPAFVFAQAVVTNVGTNISISNGASIFINGSYVSKSVKEEETARAGFIVNEAVSTTGKLIITDSIANYNDPTFKYFDPASKNMIDNYIEVIFQGKLKQRITGSTPIHFYKISINKEADSVILFQHCQINNTLTFLRGNVHLNHHAIFLEQGESETCKLVNESAASRIVDHRNGRGIVYTIFKDYNSKNYPNPAGLGITFLGEGTSFGTTVFTRGHGKQGGSESGSASTGPGDGSILRYYQVKAEISQSASFKINYFDDELDGLIKSDLDFWASEGKDKEPGVRWTKVGGDAEGANDIKTSKNLWLENTRFTLAPKTCTQTPVIPLPTLPVYLCETKDTVLDAGNPNMEFKWSTGETTQTITVSEAGNYSVDVTNAQGCSQSASVAVTQVKNPTASINASEIAVCLGVPIRFRDFSQDPVTPSSALHSKWKFGLIPEKISTSKDTAVTYINPGSYVVSLETRNQFGCTHAESKTVIVSPVPEADFSVDNVCQGTEVNPYNSSTIAYGGMTYVWQLGDGTASVDENPNHSYAVASRYNITLTATANGSFCSSSRTKAIDIYALPAADFSYSGNCLNDAVNFTNTSSITPASTLNYTWNFDDGTVSNTRNPSKTFDIPRAYQVQLTTRSNYGCISAIKKTVIVNNCDVDCSTLTPYVNLKPDRSICDGQTVTLDAGHHPGSTYYWSDQSSGQVLTVGSSGNYFVSVTSEEGCVGFDDVQVDVTPNFSLSLGTDKLLCNTTSGVLISPVISRQGTFQYSWGSDQGVTANTADLKITKPGKYWVLVTEPSGCGFFDRDTIEVKQTNNSIYAEFLVNSEAEVGTILEFVQLSYPDPISFTWNFGDRTTSEEAQPSHQYLTDGRFKVLLTVANQVCSDTLSKYVVIKKPPIEGRAIEKEEIVIEPVNDNIHFIQLPDPVIYPNPSTGKFSYELILESETIVEIQIYSLAGVLLQSKRVKGSAINEHFNISNQTPGMYAVRTQLNDQVVVIKILKQ